jgi:hypothetical protein
MSENDIEKTLQHAGTVSPQVSGPDQHSKKINFFMAYPAEEQEVQFS